MTNQSIMLVEDDEALRSATAQLLELGGHDVDVFARADEALAALTADFTGMIVSDIRMPGMDGLAFMSHVRALDPEIPVVLVTGHGDVPMAVKALHDGAADFLVKPFAADHLVAAVRRSLAHRALVIENRRLQKLAAAADRDHPLLGQSAPMQRLRLAMAQLADATVDVLIEGETGTGKELVALLLHRRSTRRSHPFVAVNCAGLGDGAAELELFGDRSDGFPPARPIHDGQIALSSGGTLLLDDVDTLPLRVQARLLRVLEEREIQPLGAERPRALNLRVIATTKVDLARAAEAGSFRADLYYRLDATRLHVPPLRDRDDDVLALFATFVQEACDELGVADWQPEMSLLDRLRSHDWPGNVRELRSFAYDAVFNASALGREDDASVSDLPTRVAAFEAGAIEAALRSYQGNVPAVLGRLGLPRKTLYDKMTRYGLVPSQFRKVD